MDLHFLVYLLKGDVSSYSFMPRNTFSVQIIFSNTVSTPVKANVSL